MQEETRTCQNCKASFTIDASDFLFYEKMKVPAPTWCPECRFQRRLTFRNEKILYKRKCDLCRKDIIGVYPADKPYKVFCGSCWWSDKWDGLLFGKRYDPNRPFFDQLQELMRAVPHMNLVASYTTLVNSDYTNYVSHLKNCYLLFDGDRCENVLYSKTVVGLKDSMECRMVGESELCYEDIDVGRSSRVFFSEACEDSHDIYFSKNLAGCSDCFGCVNLRNKSYHIFNKPYSPEEYRKTVAGFAVNTFSGMQAAKDRAEKFWLEFPQKYAHARHNVDSTGDYIYSSKNAHFMYHSRFVEDAKYTQFMSQAPIKDVYDYTAWGDNAERIYESMSVGEHASNVRFSAFCWAADSINLEYSMYVFSSANIFGCVGLRKKEYCILNTQYSKEEFEKLRGEIIRDMNERPYQDSNGIVYRYGEFFPPQLSLHDYNESTAMEYFPLSKDEVLQKGWRWYTGEKNEYAITLKSKDIPDDVRSARDSITNEVIECSGCSAPYRIIQPELALLRKFDLPLPRKCFECRYRERSSRINHPRFYHRRCMCTGDGTKGATYRNYVFHFHGSNNCPNEFETSYAPERPEIVYCEQCYQAEIQ